MPPTFVLSARIRKFLDRAGFPSLGETRLWLERAEALENPDKGVTPLEVKKLTERMLQLAQDVTNAGLPKDGDRLRKVIALVEDRLVTDVSSLEDVRLMLDTVLDAHYGMAFHHIGDGDGIREPMVGKLVAYWKSRTQESQPRGR